MASPHIAMTPALAEPTGQPPVNGSLAQSSSRYLEVHEMQQSSSSHVEPHCFGCRALGPKYSANLDKTSVCRCCSVSWLAATPDRPATKQTSAGARVLPWGMESS
jgi:hypothetical protein